MQAKVTVDKVRKAFRVVVKDEKHGLLLLNYEIGFSMDELTKFDKCELLLFPCLRVLNNIKHWECNKNLPDTTASDIKNIRSMLKHFIKENKNEK